MDIKFPKVLGFLNLKSGTDAVTEANLQSAEDKIALLEEAKVAADLRAEQATADLKLAQDAKAKADTDLSETKGKLATLETWKKNQASVDNREEDDSNTLDTQPEASEPWEKLSASAIANAKKRVGEK